MASSDGLPEENNVSLLSQLNATKIEGEETIKQKNNNIEDMSEERKEDAEDQISALENKTKHEKAITVEEKNQYGGGKPQVQPTHQQQQPNRRILAANNTSSNRDSGISGSSNESVSQIPSPVEEENEIREEEEITANATFNSK